MERFKHVMYFQPDDGGGQGGAAQKQDQKDSAQFQNSDDGKVQNDFTQKSDQEIDTEIFKFRDPVTLTEVDLPQKLGTVDLKELMSRVISKSNREAEKKYKGLVESIKSNQSDEFESLKQKVQQLEDERLSEEERAKKERERERQKWEAQFFDVKNVADRNWNLFQENKITNDIYSAFAGYDLCNPEQTMLLLRSYGKAKIVEDNGDYKTKLMFHIDGVEDEYNPRDAVQTFLAMPQNSHHLKSNMRKGNTSDNLGKTTTDGTIIFSRSQLQKDPKAMQEYKAKIKKGESVKISND